MGERVLLGISTGGKSRASLGRRDYLDVKKEDYYFCTLLRRVGGNKGSKMAR